MQLVIKLENQDSFLIPVQPTTTVQQLYTIIGERANISDINQINLTYATQDLDITNPSTLEQLQIEELATINGSVRMTPSPTTATSQTVQANEMQRTIVITNIPPAEKQATEDALEQAFSQYGTISRIILQGDGAIAQHAVVVFETSEATIAATAFHGKELLNGTVSVFTATSLPSDGTGQATSNSGHDATVASVASVLAGGYTMGQKGLDSVKHFDEQHHISTKVKAGAEVARMKVAEVDSQLGISSTLSAGFGTASKAAGELDSKYHITEKASSAAEGAYNTAKAVSSKAMENEAIATGVKKLGGIFSSIKAFSTKTLDEARTRVNDRNSVTAEPKF